MQRNKVAEYLIGFGAEIDNSSLNQLLTLMDTTKLKAFGLSAAFVGVTSAVYKFIESVTKEEFELRKLAKQQSKSVENMNAQNKALQAMGMTLQEVNKDANLKSVYKDLVAFNKEMKLPNADAAIGKIREMQGAFWKLKSAVNYAIESIGRQVLINLEMPIKRITGYMNSISDWIKNNLNSITSKVSSVITSFSKGLIGIGETIGKIFNWIGQMPAGVKNIATAIGLVIGLLNSGPLGKIMALITFIGEVIHDAEVYQWNQNNARTGEYLQADGKTPVKVDTYLTGIWDVIFGAEGEGKTTSQKSKDIFSRIIESINKGLRDAINELNSGDNSEITKWVETLTGPLGEIFVGISDWATSGEGQAQLSLLVNNLITAIGSVLSVAGELGVDLTSSMAKLITQLFEGTNWEQVWKESAVSEFLQKDNGFAVGISTAIETALLGGNLVTSLFAGALAGYHNTRRDSLLKLYQGLNKVEKEELGAPDYDDNGNILYSWLEEKLGQSGELEGVFTEDLKTDFSTMMNAVIQTLFKGFEITGDIASVIFGAIGTKLKEVAVASDNSGALSKLSEAFTILGKQDSIFGEAFGVGIAATAATGNWIIGIISGLVDLINQAIANPSQFETEFKELGTAMGEFFAILWDGDWIDVDDKSKGRKGGMLKDLLFGKDEGNVILNKIKEWLAPIGDMIVVFFQSLWVRIYNSAPQWLRDALGFAGIENPNTSTIYKNKDGTYTIESTNGNKKVVSAQEANALKGQLGNIVIGDDGSYRTKDGSDPNSLFGNSQMARQFFYNNDFYQKWIEENGGLYETTPEGIKNLLNNTDMWEKFVQQIYNGNEGWAVSDLLGKKGKSEHGEGFGLDPSVNTEVATQQLDQWISTMEGTKTVKIKAEVEGEGDKKAWGGRIGRRIDGLTVGEDGTEYIIPITKPDRAASLIKQMFGEMGSSAVSQIIGSLGLGESGTFGASLSSLSTAMSGMTMANTYNINAPVNINVNSSGADAKEIGSNVYNLAERHLIKNLMGVYA